MYVLFTYAYMHAPSWSYEYRCVSFAPSEYIPPTCRHVPRPCGLLSAGPRGQRGLAELFLSLSFLFSLFLFLSFSFFFVFLLFSLREREKNTYLSFSTFFSLSLSLSSWCRFIAHPPKTPGCGLKSVPKMAPWHMEAKTRTCVTPAVQFLATPT